MAIEPEVLRNLLKKRPVTLKYPEERIDVPEFRGPPVVDIEKCVGCGMCVRVCPPQAIELIGGVGKAFKGLRINLGACIYCGMCAENCPRKAIEMTNSYENFADNADNFIVEYLKEKAEEQKASAQ